MKFKSKEVGKPLCFFNINFRLIYLLTEFYFVLGLTFNIETNLFLRRITNTYVINTCLITLITKLKMKNYAFNTKRN